jgi:hypothetical protein
MDISHDTAVPDFGLPPLVPGDWRALPADLEAAFLQRLEASGLLEDGQKVETVRVLPLDFFEGWMLCDLLMGEVGPSADPELAAMVVLYGRDGFTPLADYRRIERHIELHGIDLTTEALCRSFVHFAATFGALGEAVPLPQTRRGERPVHVDFRPGEGGASPLDGVRAPAVARAAVQAVSKGMRLSLEVRLASDGEITVLAHTTLGPATLSDPVRREGAMRYGPRHEAESA